jgi:hypothetical protein
VSPVDNAIKFLELYCSDIYGHAEVVEGLKTLKDKPPKRTRSQDDASLSESWKRWIAAHPSI